MNDEGIANRVAMKLRPPKKGDRVVFKDYPYSGELGTVVWVAQTKTESNLYGEINVKLDKMPFPICAYLYSITYWNFQT
jgi:hypothetical protein